MRCRDDRRAGTATRLRGGGGERKLEAPAVTGEGSRDSRRDSDRRWVGLVSRDSGEEEERNYRPAGSGEEVQRSEMSTAWSG
jgi:hypothetical protein